MDEEKRKIIVKEIRHWRNSKLLPEHYCDFLLHLYQNNLEDKEVKTKRSSGFIEGVINWKKWMFGFAFALGIGWFAVHFTSFPFPMQIAAALLAVALCYSLGTLQINRSPLLSYLGFGAGSVLFLLAGIEILKLQGMDEPLPVVIHLGLSSLVWIATGLLARMNLFHFCGWVGLLLIYGWLLLQGIVEFRWWLAQTAWLPLSVLLLTAAWMLRNKWRQGGTVLFVVGSLLWFTPELFALAATGYNESVQYWMVGKMALAIAILFAFRKTWTQWVIWKW